MQIKIHVLNKKQDNYLTIKLEITAVQTSFGRTKDNINCV